MSNTVGIVWDATFLEHDAGSGHPERPERLVAIREVLQSRQLWTRLHQLPSRKAERFELERGHAAEHVTEVLNSAGKERTFFDGDTQSSPRTCDAALLAAGGAIDLARSVVRGDIDRGFSFGRPPGHHAEYDRAMGFCYFNNVVLAALAMLEEEGLERILIVDWDVHHGNGTQHILEEDPRVAFLSTHQGNFYPGTGNVSEIGRGSGRGYTINVPLPAGMGDHDYRYCFQAVVAPLVRQFKPELILLSAGYDAHSHDPLGGMSVSAEGFAAMATDLCQLADQHCGGKIVGLLEGGYGLGGLSTSVAATLQVFLGDSVELSGEADKACTQARRRCADVQGVLKDFWTFDLD